MASSQSLIRGESSGNSGKSFTGVPFPAKEGIVQGTYMFHDQERTFKLKVYKNMFIHDVYVNPDGRKGVALKGIGQEALVTNIWKEVAYEDDRTATVFFLMQIQKAIEAKETFVNTIFGLKCIRGVKKKSVSYMDLPSDAEALMEEFK